MVILIKATDVLAMLFLFSALLASKYILDLYRLSSKWKLQNSLPPWKLEVNML